MKTVLLSAISLFFVGREIEGTVEELKLSLFPLVGLCRRDRCFRRLDAEASEMMAL